MNCPACANSSLLPFKIGADTVDECAQCHGLWFNRENLGDVEDLPDSDLMKDFQDQLDNLEPAKSMAAKPLACPLCRKPMDRYQYDLSSGIWVQACPDREGVWLERGEVIKIHRHLVQGARDWPEDKMQALYAQTAGTEIAREKTEDQSALAGLGGGQRLVYHLMNNFGAF